MLQRMYQSEGGSEVCDTLMKYLYKGMAQGPPAGSNSTQRNITPQATGFSQIGGRNFGGGEGGGQAMSVLLSWHEKVSMRLRQHGDGLELTTVQLVEICGPGSIVRVMSDRRTV